MRVLFYASNGHGLGHLMRTMGIARAMRRMRPSIEFLFVTNSEACHLAWRDDFPTVKLLSLPADFAAWPETRKEWIRTFNGDLVQAAVRGFDPDLAVVDFFPLGMSRELVPLVGHRSVKVFVARERNPQRPPDPGYIDTVRRLYDLVIVPHDELEQSAFLPAGKPVRCVGAIMVRSRDEALPRDKARTRVGLPRDGFLVYVGFGGGGRRDYDQALAWVLSHADGFPDWTFVVPRPPLHRSELLEFGGANIRQVVYAPLAEGWAAFDAAVSGLGFNGVAELLHHGVPTIFVELPAMMDNWAGRGRRIAEAGAGFHVKWPDDQALRRAFLGLADSSRRKAITLAAQTMVPDNGADRAAEAIFALMEQR